MKNWNRVVKLQDVDVVVQRIYDDEESEKAPYKVDVIVNVEGVLNKASFGFTTEEEQIQAYDSITKDDVHIIYDNVMQFH